ncbi:MAG: hypothetical protein E6Q76_06610 [Rhizobium sp.]|nr:MAG: hypothetical protein E6Q76_06610 [Rhizobium sp.]
MDQKRHGIREYGFVPGRFDAGPSTAMTGVAALPVGHVPCRKGDFILTGAAAILQSGGNPLQDRMLAGSFIFNDPGKFAGKTPILPTYR